MGENLNMHEEVVAEPVEEMAAPCSGHRRGTSSAKQSKRRQGWSVDQILVFNEKAEDNSCRFVGRDRTRRRGGGRFFLFFTVFYGGAVLQSLLL